MPRSSGRNWLSKVVLVFGFGVFHLHAQAPQQVPPAIAVQMVMQPQAPVENSLPEHIFVTAEFDPPLVRPGDRTLYRATIGATENSIAWPANVAAPAALRAEREAHGQLTQPDGTPFRPLTEFIHEFSATTAGRYVIPNFTISAGGQRVEIPAAGVSVKAGAPVATPRKLLFEVSETNLFFGQPFRVRVILPAGAGNQIEAFRDVQFNGGGLLTDKFVTRNTVQAINQNGQLKSAFTYETVATPLATGRVPVFAQAFTVGNSLNNVVITAPSVITPSASRSTLLLSDAVILNVRPLPTQNEPPSFTGAIGKFLLDSPKLATNHLRVGQPVQMLVVFHSEGELTRLVPPAVPRSSDWQIIIDPPPAMKVTLIPETDEVTNTPAIPFSYFDPAKAQYVDLTIPSVPVTITGDALPTELRPTGPAEESSAPLKLAPLAAAPGKTSRNLTPLQMRGWFAAAQLLPAAGFFALWQWDRRRRFLEAHPDIVRRRRARRALRREKRKLQSAVAADNAAAFVRHAAAAMSIAAAPHYPANPLALVGGDVLAQLDDPERNGAPGETVKKIFAAAASQFSSAPPAQPDMLELEPAVETVLQKLEARL